MAAIGWSDAADDYGGNAHVSGEEVRGGTQTVYVDGVKKFSQTALPDNFMPQFVSTVGAQATPLSVIFGITAQDANAMVS